MSNALWEKVNKLWDGAEDKSGMVQEYWDYWEGNLKQEVQANSSKSDFNKIKAIIETKLKAMLDAQFTLSVVPAISSNQDLQTIKTLQTIADIYNDELHNVLKVNNMDSLKEQIARFGMICGFGAAQTTWEVPTDKVEGQIKISFIDSKNLKWDKAASKIEDATFIAYKIQMNPAIAKRKYCRNAEGQYDLEKCNLIDELANSNGSGGSNDSNNALSKAGKFVTNYLTSTTSGQAYMYNSDCIGIKDGKIVELVVMFLLDDSLYAPEKDDNSETESLKAYSTLKYPYGRMLIFSPNKKNKMIFEDIALDENFKNLGNIDIFNPVITNKIEGKGEVEDLTGIQDRINNLILKYRTLISNDFSTVMVDKASLQDGGDASLGNIVDQAVTFYNGVSSIPPQLLSNQGIEKAAQVLDVISKLGAAAYEVARVNETLIQGIRQTGTTSGDQVELLNESPLSDIRALQRNFKDFMVSMGDKIISFIHNNYSVNRLIKLTTKQDAAYASIYTTSNEQGEEQKQIDLINELGQPLETLKIEQDWKFQVEVIAGTEVPRSRKEMGMVLDKLLETGILGDVNDIDFKEIYLKSQDIPNANAFIKLLRQKADDAQNQKPTMEDVLKNPVLTKNVADMLKALAGFSNAKAQILKTLGMDAQIDTLETAPIQETASQSDINEIALLAPSTISQNPQGMIQSQNYAKAHALTKAAEATDMGSEENIAGGF
jgi:hypothetical protein